jgi:iron-sulfur cluster assembly protein
VRVERGPITVVVDAMSLQYLVGAEIDFEDKLDGARFVIRNPNASQHLRLRQFLQRLREQAMTITVTPKAANRSARRWTSAAAAWACAWPSRPAAARAMPTRWNSPTRRADDDLRFDSEGVQLLVAAGSLPMIDGTQLDWVREGLNEGFKFNNPNATADLRLRRVVQGLTSAARHGLLQIAEPGRAAAPHQHRLAVGIDLGTTNSLVATVRSAPAHGAGRRGRPRAAAFGRALRRRRHAERGPRSARQDRGRPARNTVASAKRLIGRSLADVAATAGALCAGATVRQRGGHASRGTA